MQNAIPNSANDDGDVVARVASRALARRHEAYAEEVRRLLDAGLAVMRRAGTSGTPKVADIVREAGLSNVAFYRHFTGKDDLVAALVEAGSARLVGYLTHQMDKERTPEGRIRRWVEGVMSQAGNPDVADATRSVLWNGTRATDQYRTSELSNERFAELLIEPLTEYGSADPSRDAKVITHAVMGRMQEFLWRRVLPSRRDVTHLVRFCLAAVDRA